MSDFIISRQTINLGGGECRVAAEIHLIRRGEPTQSELAPAFPRILWFPTDWLEEGCLTQIVLRSDVEEKRVRGLHPMGNEHDCCWVSMER